MHSKNYIVNIQIKIKIALEFLMYASNTKFNIYSFRSLENNIRTDRQT
jgi:hypothetical protein